MDRSGPLVFVLVTLVAWGMVLLRGLKRTKAPAAEVFPLRSVRAAILAATAVSAVGLRIALSEVANLLRFVLPAREDDMRFIPDLLMTNFWATLLLLVVVARITEELFFRGLVLRGLLTRYAPTNARLASALPFAAAHIPLFAAAHITPWEIPGAFVVGLLFAWCFIRTRSLLPGLFGHAIANLMAVAAVAWPGPKTPGTGVLLAVAGLYGLARLFRGCAQRANEELNAQQRECEALKCFQ
jgi:membrane protease YdiL (CAAX protease family)